jgi:hypothetical protein
MPTLAGGASLVDDVRRKDPAVDDHTLERAMLGVFLLSASAMRADRNAGRAMNFRLLHGLTTTGHRWRIRASQASALGTGAVGLAVLLLALRESSRAQTPTVSADGSRTVRSAIVE